MSRIRGPDTKWSWLFGKNYTGAGIAFASMLPGLPGSRMSSLRKSVSPYSLTVTFSMAGNSKAGRTSWLRTGAKKSQAARRATLSRNEGWIVMRFWEHDVDKNLEGCIERIESKIAQLRQSTIEARFRLWRRQTSSAGKVPVPRFTLGATMAKKSDAARKAKLKERRRKAKEAQARPLTGPSKVENWMAVFDAERNIIVELIGEDGAVLAYIEGDDTDSWTVIVGDKPVSGIDDEIVALGWLVGAAVDDIADGNAPVLVYSHWIVEQVEARCEATNLEWHDFLRSLLPAEKQHMQLPQQRTM